MMLKLHLNQQQSTECNKQKEMCSFQSRLLYSFLPNETQAVTHHPKLAAINKRVVTLHHPINILGLWKPFCYYIQCLLLCLYASLHCLQVCLPQTSCVHGLSSPVHLWPFLLFRQCQGSYLWLHQPHTEMAHSYFPCPLTSERAC